MRSLPMTRGDCENGPRPCPHQTCRYHLGTGSQESCTLDVADRGGQTLEQVGEILGITKERVRQIEERALLGARQRMEDLEMTASDWKERRIAIVNAAIERAPAPAPSKWRILTAEQQERISERQRKRRAEETPEQREERLAYLRGYCLRRRQEKKRPWQAEAADIEIQADHGPKRAVETAPEPKKPGPSPASEAIRKIREERRRQSLGWLEGQVLMALHGKGAAE